MAIDLTGITNENEFYTSHYLTVLLEGDLKDVFKRWEEEEQKNGNQAPYKRLGRLAREYFAFRSRLERERRMENRMTLCRDLFAALLPILGYPYSPTFKELDDGARFPILGEIKKPNGSPELWIVEALNPLSDPEDPLSLTLMPCQSEPDGKADKQLVEATLDEIITKKVFGCSEPPRWIVLLSDAQILLVDRSKWNEKRFLRFDMPEIFNRREVSTLKAFAALLHRESVVPSEGISLLDSLDENSHKHAFQVSEDLKYTLREAVELLGNEAVWYLNEKRKKGIYSGEEKLDAKELTKECLRYMYRLLFLFFIEARPELGYLPMDSDEYRMGCSLEALRDLELTSLTTEESKEGFFIHESLQLLFELIYSGFPSDGKKGDQHTLEKADFHIFRIPTLRSHLFDPTRTPTLNKIKFRNHVMQKVIELMSLSKPRGNHQRRGRISYAQLGINQLGAVYEALLSYQGFFAEEDLYEVHKAGEPCNELEPAYFVKTGDLEKYTDEEKVYNDDGGLKKYPKGTFIYRLAGRDREKSASYYTPEVLTKCLVKYALKELLKDKKADDVLELTVCEPAMGSAAFLNEAINQLAEAYLDHKQKETSRSIAHDEYAGERQKVKMFIADNNVYGVDLNPVAVELAEVSLWLNTIHQGAYVPWFGMQLVTGNSLIGARRQVFDRKLLKKSENEEPLWLDEVPERIMPGTDRQKGMVYHFLLPDRGMAAYKDKVVRDMAKAEIKKIGEWRKGFIKPFSDGQIEHLEKLSAAIDRLYSRHIQQQRSIRQRTTDALQIFGQDGPGKASPAKTTEEKDRIYYQEMLSKDVRNSSPYRRLRLAMDYWCSLWFWPIDKADLLPTRQEFLLDLSLILEGNVIEIGVAKGQMDPLFPETIPMQEALKLVDEFGYVDVDRLCRETPRLGLVQELSEKYHFLHWELQFADIFAGRGGFDLVLGNPPWIKMEWNEGGLMGDAEPLFVLKRLSAPQLSHIRADTLRRPGVMQAYLTAFESAEGTQNFFSAPQNYPILKGIQPNLYKCFISKAWEVLHDEAVAGFLHPEGVYDDPNGGRLREQIYQRIKYHFQFVNVKKLFAEILHWVTYSINIYGPKGSEVGFSSIGNLFTPQTIDASYEHSGIGYLGGIKDDANKWNIVGHKDRILSVNDLTLLLFAQLFDNKGTPLLQARLPVVHSCKVVEVLRKFAACPQRLSDIEGEYLSTVMWDETGAVKAEIIKRATQFTGSLEDFIFSGPHFYVGNPLSKTPMAVCNIHHDYDCIDLTAIPDDYLPRSNYVPCCSREFYELRSPKATWNHTPVTDYYRVIASRRLSQSGERTLQSAIAPKRTGHIDSVFGISFQDSLKAVLVAAAWASIPYDFMVKTTGKGDFRHDLAGQLPILDGQFTKQLILRGLLLNCLTIHYSDLWQECWHERYLQERWTKDDPRLHDNIFTSLRKEWHRNCAFRTDYERRQALVEIDVLSGIALCLTRAELRTIYRLQFPVLRQNENDTWYDQNGRIVFTCSKGLPGVGFSRPEWEKIKDMKSGTVSRTIMDDTLPGGPYERTIVYEAPFDRCDREQDYEIAWAEFERRFKETRS